LDERYVVAILPGNTLRVHFSHEPGFLREAQKMRPAFEGTGNRKQPDFRFQISDF
jgi:hypothetical protein